MHDFTKFSERLRIPQCSSRWIPSKFYANSSFNLHYYFSFDELRLKLKKKNSQKFLFPIWILHGCFSSRSRGPSEHSTGPVKVGKQNIFLGNPHEDTESASVINLVILKSLKLCLLFSIPTDKSPDWSGCCQSIGTSDIWTVIIKKGVYYI